MPARRRSSGAALQVAAGVGAGLALSSCAATVPPDPRAADLAPADGAEAPVGTARADDTDDGRRTSSSDGTYSGSGSYETPGGPQRIDVTVVLADGRVTAVRVDPAATNTTSRRFQERFASAVVDAVVGRSLDDVAVDRLAGSSSTGVGFMAALDEVARDAADA